MTDTMEKKSNMEQLAELMNELTKEQQEYVAAHLLGTVNGVMLAQEMAKEKKSA